MWRLPDLVKLVARCALALAWLAFAGLHALGIAGFHFAWARPQEAALLVYVMTLCAILALPRRRVADIAALMAALLTLPEFASAAASHRFDVQRWVLELAFVAAALLPLLVERLRRRAVQSDQISFYGWSDREGQGEGRRSGARRLSDLQDR